MANKKRKIQQSNAVKPSSKNDDANAPTSAKIATTDSMSVGLVSDDDSVFADDLVLTLDFLNTRCLANPTEFKTNKKFKELRTLLFKLLPILGGAAGPSGGENNIDSTSTSVNKLSHRITESLASQSWESAMYNLKQLQITGKIPKLGSVQRWIRHASVTRDSNDIDDHDIYFPLMDAIIRAADPTQVFQIVGEVPKRAYSSLKRDVCILETFEPFVAPVNPDASTSNPTTSSSSPSYCSSLQFDLITEEKGLDEKTHIQIYNCRNPEEMDLRKNRMPEIVKHRIPFVQGI